jgi:tetratricopeptide (TPR) repeat protein
MELERNNKPGAEAFLLQSTRYSSQANSLQRNRSFLQLANISFEEKKYRAARNFYDSLTISPTDAASLGDISWLPDRKAALAVIVAQLQVIDRQDSLQRVAAMPAPQRDAYIKKLVRALRRQQGLHDESDSSVNSNLTGSNNAANSDMFRSSPGAADWYFNNPSLKAKGYTEFRTKWGNRPNVDNWQISSAMKVGNGLRPGQQNPMAANTLNQGAASNTIDFKTLLGNLPLTPEKMQHSMDSIEAALFTMAKTFQDDIPDYLSAVNTYDSLLTKFPETRREQEVLFSMYYCYRKLGDDANAARILERLKQKYPGGPFTTRAANPDSTLEASGSLKVKATRQYEKIYLDYIEGRFDEAESGKRVADSLYGDKYWTPQLLYIESVYLIRARRDPQARSILSTIQAKWPKTPIAAKAANLLDVLSRRKEIEDYLTRLQVTRAKDEDSIVVDNTKPTPAPDNRPRLVRNDSNLLIKNKPAAGKPGAGIDKLKTDSAAMNKIVMDSSRMTQLRQLQDSLKAAAIKASNDSARAAAIRHATDSINAVMARIKDSTDRLAANLRSLNSVFSLAPDKPHSVLIVLNKVDPVYVNETKNAFSRYNTEEYYSQQLTTASSDLTDSIKMVVIGSFGNANDALDYLQKAKALAPRQIVPWLPAGKYSFLIISGPNLDLLLNNKDLSAYRKFLQAAYPGKF